MNIFHVQTQLCLAKLQVGAKEQARGIHEFMRKVNQQTVYLIGSASLASFCSMFNSCDQVGPGLVRFRSGSGLAPWSLRQYVVCGVSR